MPSQARTPCVSVEQRSVPTPGTWTSAVPVTVRGDFGGARTNTSMSFSKAAITVASASGKAMLRKAVRPRRQPRHSDDLD
jgi:hypothetical protein